jgi:hypothetical protein
MRPTPFLVEKREPPYFAQMVTIDDCHPDSATQLRNPIDHGSVNRLNWKRRLGERAAMRAF